MHIALYTHSRLPAEGYGGTQRVVVWLARGLVELGHRVTLLAPAGSRVPEAELVPLNPRDIMEAGFDLTPLLPASADILHAHGPVRMPPDHP
ncbi:MAG TPA: glycosyltransferase, partial [Gemmatimonadales bacterium]|nr:glycosyltransferase [Gemmatimonadales bacterium]